MEAKNSEPHCHDYLQRIRSYFVLLCGAHGGAESYWTSKENVHVVDVIFWKLHVAFMLGKFSARFLILSGGQKLGSPGWFVNLLVC
ncbi:hypothetical protein TorRG33x02_313660 [Trema orientale]|uniref:Uncharacterized protein n=1 Tax=Trema orientale TaxID=63057 RepID=A0A2P5BP48_TREOI|nr:hypothetical protein TorRG33x02_313660 [Trema orientale]